MVTKEADKKKVVYVGYGNYKRDLGDGKIIELFHGVVTPVSDELFKILKDIRDVHPVIGEQRIVIGDWKKTTIRE